MEDTNTYIVTDARDRASERVETLMQPAIDALESISPYTADRHKVIAREDPTLIDAALDRPCVGPCVGRVHISDYRNTISVLTQAAEPAEYAQAAADAAILRDRLIAVYERDRARALAYAAQYDAVCPIGSAQ